MKTDDYYTDEVVGLQGWLCGKCNADVEQNVKTLLTNDPKARYMVCPACEVQIDFKYERVVTTTKNKSWDAFWDCLGI